MPAPDITPPEVAMPEATPQVPDVPAPETLPPAPEPTIPLLGDVPEPTLTPDGTITFDDEPVGNIAADPDEEI